MSKSPKQLRQIKYTRQNGYTVVCFACSIMYLLLWLVLEHSGTQVQPLACQIAAGLFFVAGVICLIYFDNQVFIDRAGIHSTWRNGEQLLILRETLPNCRMITEGNLLIIYVFREEAPAEYPALFLENGLPEREYYLKFELGYMLHQIKRGKMTQEDLLSQPIIMLQFFLMESSIQRFYRKFLTIWKGAESYHENTGEPDRAGVVQ